MLEDLNGRCVKVEQLDENDQVLGDCGRAVRVVSKQIHPKGSQALVELHLGPGHRASIFGQLSDILFGSGGTCSIEIIGLGGFRMIFRFLYAESCLDPKCVDFDEKHEFEQKYEFEHVQDLSRTGPGRRVLIGRVFFLQKLYLYCFISKFYAYSKYIYDMKHQIVYYIQNHFMTY